MRDMWKPAALGLAAAMALSVAIPAAAAPVLSNATDLKAAVPDDATQVRWRGHRGHGWVPGAAAGLAAGAVIGGAIATSPYYAHDPYYGDAYAYSGPGYFYGSPALTAPRRFYDRDCLGDYDSAGVRC